ncbi:hypothetical protein QBC35DRAFT_484753 [Podospora australis]|uniref:Uncharacterized protein n=1 Tax=Podospora australis TaxID=1536484 RepID=A0AAN7ANX0_9PEZI|nr:hypothetical protein QBC35DRAFT_484753 [Podospora australis]
MVRPFHLSLPRSPPFPSSSASHRSYPGLHLHDTVATCLEIGALSRPKPFNSSVPSPSAAQSSVPQTNTIQSQRFFPAFRLREPGEHRLQFPFPHFENRRSSNPTDNLFLLRCLRMSVCPMRIFCCCSCTHVLRRKRSAHPETLFLLDPMSISGVWSGSYVVILFRSRGGGCQGVWARPRPSSDTYPISTFLIIQEPPPEGTLSLDHDAVG